MKCIEVVKICSRHWWGGTVHLLNSAKITILEKIQGGGLGDISISRTFSPIIACTFTLPAVLGPTF